MRSLHHALKTSKADGYLLQEIVESHFDPNENDASGNTLFHILAGKITLCNDTSELRIYFRIAEILLQKDANVNLRNCANQTPTDVFLFGISNSNTLESFRNPEILACFLVPMLSSITPELLVKMLNLFPNTISEEELYKINNCVEFSNDLKGYRSNHNYRLIMDFIDLSQLSIECLEALSKWSIDTYKLYGKEIQEQANQFNQKLSVEIDNRLEGLKQHPNFVNSIQLISHAKEEERIVLIRAMLTNFPIPLRSLLSDCNENLFLFDCPETVLHSLKKFIAEYEQARLVMEKYHAVPQKLIPEEIKTITPFYKRLSTAYLDEQVKNNWYLISDMKRKLAVTKELNQNSQLIQSGRFLGDHGMWRQQQDKHHVQRKACANAAENRMKH